MKYSWMLSSSFLSKRALICVVLFCIVSLFFSCTYKERFIIKISEGNTLPCIGVSQFTFIVEALEDTQDEIVKHQYAKGAADSELFWELKTGKCSLPDGIPLTRIPYGGQRHLIIRAFDSQGQLISKGKSSPFLLERSGDEVQDIITMDFKRESTIGTGTLIIRFDNPLPAGTDRIQLFLQPHKSQSGADLPQESRGIPINKVEPPSFIIVSNIPPSAGRPIVLHAIRERQTLKTSSVSSYSIGPGTNNQYVDRIAIRF